MKRKIISLILVAVMLMAIPFSLASCDKTDKLGKGACEYAETRDISGRNIKYVEICFEGYCWSWFLGSGSHRVRFLVDNAEPCRSW